jgi:hypothetical protein
MKKAAQRKKAAVQLTAGTGFRNENCIAARFLLDLLAGTNTLGAEFGRVERVQWQGRDLGWFSDDLVIECATPTGNREAGISIKSDRQVTSAGFPSDFVGIAWAQWLGVKTERVFRTSDNAIALMVGSLAHDVEDAWSNMLSDARRTTPERMLARLTENDAADGQQSSAIQRALFASLRCPEELRNEGDTSDSAAVQLLCRIRLMKFDFEATPSRDHDHALRDCQDVLRSGDADEAKDFWSHIVAIADANRAGGSLDLAGLLTELRDQFDLRDHPDYRRDWEALDQSSQEAMADIRGQISGLAPLPRDEARAKVLDWLDRGRACFLVGESGSGKSALAKQIAEANYDRRIWFTETVLDHDAESVFERAIGTSHPLCEILSASSESCLIVFDSIERYSPRALRLAHRWMQALLAGPKHVHLLVTAQIEPVTKLIRGFIEAGVPAALHKTTPLDFPSVDDIQDLVAPMAELQWASLRPELRPLLTNLKILDWLVAATRTGMAINPASIIGVSHLVDALWERWVEGDTDQLSRSHLLMRLGTLEGDTLQASVPRMQLSQSEQAALASLTASDLVRVRDQRVRFTHDMLGDWARLNVLIGEAGLSAPTVRARTKFPRWHRALRLYGQRLLEQADDGPDRWRQAIEGLEDGSEEGTIIRDQFVDALFLATNAAVLLERSWGALAANRGRLLKLMLDRFMFVATLPDPRIEALLSGSEVKGEWEHLFRMPYWPYWGPMLTALHAHRADVARLVPHAAAKLCALWLKSVPVEIAEGHPMPWRKEAAELALIIGREVQALNAEGNYYSDGQDKVAYEAALSAAQEMPDETAQLCLELAQRRDLDPAIVTRVEQAQERRREQRRQFLEANPERQRRSFPPSWPRGERREPWPDGPRDGVENAFQDACLETGAFPPLVRARPDAALEVLLAVCIEPPKEEDFGRRSMPETGLDHWDGGDPPLYCRGPFLQFLQLAPEQGLSFALRLVNFASRRFSEGHGLDVRIGNETRLWYGDTRVFRWHHDLPVTFGSTVHCVLMAVERWFYDQIDRGQDVTPWIDRILRESESLAFAGLLLDVGKYHPILFAGALKPLLRNWLFLDWDRQVTTMRQSGTSDALGFWGYQPSAVIALGRAWYQMPHRKDFLIYLGGGIVKTLVADEAQGPFLAELRSAWVSDRGDKEQPETLRLLSERLNPENYSFEIQDGKRIAVSFDWSDAVKEKNQQDLARIAVNQTVMTFPFQCRQLLDSDEHFGPDQLPQFWEFVQGIESLSPELAHDGDPLHHIEDLLCGAIAVLIVKHYDWLAADPERLAWCRAKLEAVLARPPERLGFDSEGAPGDRKWDAFAAEAGVALLARDRNDLLARRLVATGVLSFHYSTVSRTLIGACQCRQQLGDDFDRMPSLALRWEGQRAGLGFARRIKDDASADDNYHAAKNRLIEEFVSGQTPLELPNILDLSAHAEAEIEAVRVRQFPEMARLRRRETSSRRPGSEVETLHRERLSLDARFISAAFAWLDVKSARPEERAKWLGLVRRFLDITLGFIPKITDPRHQRTDDRPDEFDSWVFSLVAATIPCLTTAEDHRTLWQPILDQGSPAHNWVERFFWEWFTAGLRAAQSPEQFAEIWSTMIERALQSPAWDPAVNRSYDLDNAVFWLFGLGTRINKIGERPEYSTVLAGMEGLFARAAARWFKIPKLVSGFLYWVTQPSAAGLLVPAIRWLAPVVPTFDSYEWRNGLEGNLIVFLRACWERKREQISADPDLERDFSVLLTTAVSRGSHAAIALRDHIVTSAAA